MIVAEIEQPIKPTAPKIGIIYPPAEVRNIVDKTASFVARNGPEFESRIRQNGLNNPKFNFLNPKDPYHAYYQQKVKDFASGKPQEAPISIISGTQTKSNQEIPKKIVETFAPKDPPPEFEFVYDPPSITAQDIDIVKLTAQFVARNGRSFLTQLMNREQRNYQFDFLRAQHPMFGYFTTLVEQYTKILIPPKDLNEKLNSNLNDCKKLTDEVKYRVEWQKYEEQQRKKEEEAAEKERIAYALIDWHDFVVVETVDFQPNEIGNFPLPTTPDEVGARTIARERGEDDQNVTKDQPASQLPQIPGTGIGNISDEEDGLSDQEEDVTVPNVTSIKYRADLPVMEHVAEDDMELSDEEHSDGEETEKEKPTDAPKQQTTKSQPNPSQVVIRDYNPKSSSVSKQDDSKTVMLISPFTGERIPANQAPKHVRVGLLDPKWVEQKDKEIRQKHEEDQVFAPGQIISSNLKQLAERRTDIFGVGTDETQVTKEGNESRPLMWDGHSDSIAAVTKRAKDAVTPQQIQMHMEERQRRQAELNEIGVSLPTNPLLPPPPPVQFTMPPPPPPPVMPDGGDPSQAKRPKDQ